MDGDRKLKRKGTQETSILPLESPQLILSLSREEKRRLGSDDSRSGSPEDPAYWP